MPHSIEARRKGLMGRKLSEETKKKISESKNKNIPAVCMECENTFYIKPGRKETANYCSKDCMYNSSKWRKTYTGENHWNWSGGIYVRQGYKKIRDSSEYKKWRQAVLKRDGYQCVECESEESLHVDHIKPFSKFPELRTNPDNGRVLCKDCHIKTDTWGWKVSAYGK